MNFDSSFTTVLCGPARAACHSNVIKGDGWPPIGSFSRCDLDLKYYISRELLIFTLKQLFLKKWWSTHVKWMRSPDGHHSYTSPSGIRIKCPSGRRSPLYKNKIRRIFTWYDKLSGRNIECSIGTHCCPCGPLYRTISDEVCASLWIIFIER